MFEITPRRAALSLSALVALFTVAHIAGLISIYVLGEPNVRGLVPLFDFDRERNLPTLFATLLLLLCAGILYVIALLSKRNHRPSGLWSLLSAIFVFLAIDEHATLHERLIGPVGDLLNTSGIFLYAWIIPYGAFVVVLMFLYGRFVLALPPRPRLFIVLAGCLYISGAIGAEMVGGWYWSEILGLDTPDPDATYHLIVTVEELLEFSGLVIFVYGLLSYIEEVFGRTTFEIRGSV